MELPKKYKFKEIEEKWKRFWKENNTYVSTIQGDKVFSVDTPPPNVSGKMHMGHALSYSQADFIMRFKRMTGHTIFYPFGTDDNGLPTERYVEKLKNLDSKSMSRSEFVDICSRTVKEMLPSLVQPWKDLGVSADFDNAYSTIDDTSIRVSQKSFLDLYHKQLAYRKETPVVWCTSCQTAIAQAEFENTQKKSKFYDIKFTDDNGEELVISTTRPELLPACVALFAHPKDTRYAHLKGKQATVPYFRHKVPIIFDESVDKEKGTGLMMVCTFGDKDDVEKWHRHGLELRTVITGTGKMNDLAGKFEGMAVKDARDAIVEELTSIGALKHSDEITHDVNVHERCGTEIEFLKTPQWFINVMDHKDELLEVGDEVNWYPSHMKVRYQHWVKNLNWDWCISRQRHFGVPFPVWYEKETGNIIVASEDDLPVDPNTQTPSSYEGDPENLIPEEDVMDTWATSSVSPQITLDWGKTSQENFQNAFPMTLRVQAHEIIRTWTFYTIVKAKYNLNTIPWKNIMISGFVLDKNGKKLSKSKGNAIDPVKIMDLYGADAVRYSASCVKLGDDIPFHEKYLQTGKKTITKLFNASKFAHLHLDDFKGGFEYDKLSTIDHWIVSRINKVVDEATSYLADYEFSKARAVIEQFFWHEFCDYYLEMVKDRLYKPEVYGNDLRIAGQMTLTYVLERVLKLFAPYLPFVTEEIYSWKIKQLNKEQNTAPEPQNTGHRAQNTECRSQGTVQQTAEQDPDRLPLTADSIHTSKWPEVDSSYISESDEKAASLACDIIAAVRQEKNTEQVSQKYPVDRLVIDADENTRALIEKVQADIAMTTGATELVYETAEDIDLENGVRLGVSLAPKEDE